MADLSFNMATDEDIELFESPSRSGNSKYDPIREAYEDLSKADKEKGIVLNDPMTQSQAGSLRTYLYNTCDMKDDLLVQTRKTDETDEDGKDLFKIRVKKRPGDKYLRK